MGYEHGRETKVYAAEFDISAYLTDSDITISAATHETHTFGDSSVERSPGLVDGRIRLSGFFDADYAGYLDTWLGSAAGEPITIAYGGGAVGDTAILGQIRTTEFGETAAVGGMVGAVATINPTGGLYSGHVLAALAALGETGNSASKDGGAASTEGGKATVHCTAVSGTSPTADIKIQDSANDSDWTDVSPAFTQLTAAGSECIDIVAGTTIDRYTREYHTIGGSDTPTLTCVVSFARRHTVP